jgi:hypothetical protein
MQHRRNAEKQGEPGWLAGPDRTQRREQRDLNRMGVNFFKMLVMLSETPISNLIVTDEEFAAVKSRIVTWIGRIHACQLTVNPELKLTVNSNESEKMIELPVASETDQDQQDQDDDPDQAGPS